MKECGKNTEEDYGRKIKTHEESIEKNKLKISDLKGKTVEKKVEYSKNDKKRQKYSRKIKSLKKERQRI